MKRANAIEVLFARFDAQLKRPAKLRQKDRDARWTVKFSKAKPREDGTPQGDIAVILGTRTTSRLIGGTD